MGWIGIDNTHYYSHCGHTSTYTPQQMLTPSGQWWHLLNATHELQLDLLASYNVTKIGLRGYCTSSACPDDIDVYVSTDGSTWGTAVGTGLDIFADWVYPDLFEYDLTPKVGRYVKLVINSTGRGDNYLGWGDSSSPYLATIDIWEGVVGDKFTSHINMLNTVSTTTSTSYTPTDGSLQQLEWDGSKYNGIYKAYLEISGYQTGTGLPNSMPALSVELYDVTNSTQLTNVSRESSSYGVARSYDFSSTLPSGVATLDIRYKNVSGTSATITGARIIIVQEVEATPKTRIYIPIGASVSRNLNTYKTCYQASMLGGPEEKDWAYVASNFGTIDAMYYHANIKATSGYTSYAQLDTIAGGSSLATLSTTSTTPSLQKSSDISSSISDSTTYTTWVKSSAVRQYAYLYNAYIIIDLSPVTKYQNFLTYNASGEQVTATGWTEDRSMIATFNEGTDYYDGITEVYKHYTTLWQINDTNVQTSFYDDSTRNSSADLLTTNSAPTVMESSALSGVADASLISQATNLNSTGFSTSGNCGWGALSIYITDISEIEEEVLVTLRMLNGVGL